MPAIFEFPMQSETLEPEEISEITGCSRRAEQVEWLSRNHWTFHKTRAGAPVVGRMYARLRMSGINPSVMATTGGWTPDFSTLNSR